MARGVFAGATTPNQPMHSKPGKPDSPTVGSSGMSAERLTLVMAESALLGVIGSAAGIALGTALAAIALRVLGGDLGGGYFAGSYGSKDCKKTLESTKAAAELAGTLPRRT